MNITFDYQNWISILIGSFIWILFTIKYFQFTQGFGKSIFALFSIFYIIVFIINPLFSYVIAVVEGILLFLWQKIKSRRKQKYHKVIAKFEAGGIRRGLTPPEIVAIFGKPFHQVVSLIFIGLLEKGFLVVEDQNNVKFKVSSSMETRAQSLNTEKRAKLRREGAQVLKQILYPFEEPFLELLEQENGKSIDEIDFGVTVKPFFNLIAERLGGFDLEKTRGYYESVIRRFSENRKSAVSLSINMNQSIEWKLLNFYLDEKYSLNLNEHPNWIYQNIITSSDRKPNMMLIKWINNLEEVVKSNLSQEDLNNNLGWMLNENSSDSIEEFIHTTYQI